MTTQEMDKPRLLLVDDDETFCKVLKSALEKEIMRYWSLTMSKPE